jgi:ankyrin repeat protein
LHVHSDEEGGAQDGCKKDPGFRPQCRTPTQQHFHHFGFKVNVVSYHRSIESILRLSTMSINTKLLEEELTEFCRSGSLSLDGLRAIIEKHGINNHPNIDYDFFHGACHNERVSEGILRCLLEYFPNAARDTGERGRLPIHIACRNKNVTLGMVQLLIDAFPKSLRHENKMGSMPLHVLCCNEYLEEIGLDILKLLLERYPGAVRHATHGMIPLHSAARNQSHEFCRLLIEAFPGSERVTIGGTGMLPFHAACALNTVATAKYFYKLYPESINVADNRGRYPIHFAIQGAESREHSPESAVETVKFLLGCDPDVVLQKKENKVPLYWVCFGATDANTRLNIYLKVLQILYDVHPEAIEEVASDVDSFCEEAQTFINAQLIYARRVRDRTLMNTRDENGQLPLHKALRGNVTLGSIKLLVKGNPPGITCADNKGMTPLHVACQFHRTPAVVDYLINLDPTSLHRKDLDDNTALHYACRGANHAIIALLTEKYDAMSVSTRNTHGQLSIDLLLQNKNEVRDEESVQCTESMYRLLRAYPMTLVHYDLRQAGSRECISQSEKKRKNDEL